MARSTRSSAALLMIVLAAMPAGADEVAGVARVIDGDTLAIGATRIRLFGIDAPDFDQQCGASEALWDCGKIAATRLTALADGRVRCTGDEHDRYGRLIATCSADGMDLGGRMVSEGLTWAFVRYSDNYVSDEADARGRQVGMWQGAAEAPWEFRANGGFRAASGTAAGAAEPGSPGCLVKGNISGDGAHIYHLPGEPSYARTRINTAKGEAWFCDEAAARAAGFRAQRGATASAEW